MITIPILVNYDQDKVIGSLTIDETKLPHNTMKFGLHPGCLVKCINTETKEINIDEFLCFSLLMDYEVSRDIL